MPDEAYENSLRLAKEAVNSSVAEFRTFLDWCESDEGIASLVNKNEDDALHYGFYRWSFIQLLEQAHKRGIDIAKFLPSAVLGFVTERHMEDADERRVIDLFVDKLR